MTMTKLTCRTVDREYAECPRCHKTLTIRVLAYSHARVCQTYGDKVTKRDAKAKEKYLHEFGRMCQNGSSDTTEETRDDNDTPMDF